MKYLTVSRSMLKVNRLLKTQSASVFVNSKNEDRFNPVGIQMLPDHLRNWIFGADHSPCLTDAAKKEIELHLKKHDLLGKKTSATKVDDVSLPNLFGKNIDEHFQAIALQQIQPYKDFADAIAAATLPPKPKKWILRPGWTKYDVSNKLCYAVSCPDENAMVFDVEVLMTEGNYPTMATAASQHAWFSWCSDRMFGSHNANKSHVTMEDLIPIDLETDSPRVVIGHNVGFDRSFIRDQYFVTAKKLRFIDTMSLHIAISGLTGLQRVLYMANKTGSKRKEVLEHNDESMKHGVFPSFKWTHESSLNNLNDVYQLYVKDALPLQKHFRDIFVSGTIEDVKHNFQDLMTYCANDVQATHKVFTHLWQEFLLRFPHPVTLAGMFEMGLTYLPVNENWLKYINTSNSKYCELEDKLNSVLFRLAREAVSLPADKYKNDVWLWDLDWSQKRVKTSSQPSEVNSNQELKNDQQGNQNTKKQKTVKKAGYAHVTRWFADLCESSETMQPTKITLQRRITPKLLRLVWDGFPLHFNDKHGWGYLVPIVDSGGYDSELSGSDPECNAQQCFPLQSLSKVCAEMKPEWSLQLNTVGDSEKMADDILLKIQSLNGSDDEDLSAHWMQLERLKSVSTKPSKKIEFVGEGPFLDVIPGCQFYKLPHKDGASKRVGNPLAKDFIGKIEQGILRSALGIEAESVLKFGTMCSYWKNNVDRISSQMVIQLFSDNLPDTTKQHQDYRNDMFLGAIAPRVVVAGTVTRRAVEPTWLTASNAYADRIGSELKAMIQSPPGYHFVGADVDSQELWIAALLGDANFHRVHGCTALSWMTLQGTKAEGTDMHSRTAKLVGISRDQAKIFNYGRIYGAGQKFAEQMLKKFNYQLTDREAQSKAKKMFLATKGRRVRLKNKLSDEDADTDGPLTEWQEGSESHMFNMLERIALLPEPRSPVLNCMISKSLEPRNVSSEFMTSRVNWVVQSSAVDYLHLMLVSMRWLFDLFSIDGRFCISIHDEVRYLVSSEHRYRAALALQLTNLLTRSMFAYKLGFRDLPLSVAFFSAVDIDTCLRKETTMDCVTPSNPHGLKDGYGIPPGESLNINEVIEKLRVSNSTSDKEALQPHLIDVESRVNQ